MIFLLENKTNIMIRKISLCSECATKLHTQIGLSIVYQKLIQDHIPVPSDWLGCFLETLETD